MASKGLECLCAKFELYVPLTAPTDEITRQELIDRISADMVECCVTSTQYIEGGDPLILTLISEAPGCKTTQSLVTVFSNLNAETGEWETVNCSVQFGNIEIDVTGDNIVFKQINVECESSSCSKGCKPSSCKCKTSCCGDSCQRKCCTFYKPYKYKHKYKPSDSEDEDFDTCCDNTGDKCRPVCEYPETCFCDPKINMPYCDYDPCNQICDDDTPGIEKLKKLPFRMPFKVTKHKSSLYYVVRTENVKYLSDKIKVKAQICDNGSVRIKVSDVQQYTSLSPGDPIFKFLNISGMWYTVDEGDSSEFYLRLGPGQHTRFEVISNTTNHTESYSSYRGFLNDLLKCDV